MFRRLRVKATVLFAGIFCIALTLIGATAYAVITENAEQQARSQLESLSAVFDRTTALTYQRLQDGAFHIAGDASLRAATAAQDERAIRADLLRLRQRISADLAYLVTRNGQIIGQHNGASPSVSPALLATLARQTETNGITRSGEGLFLTATAPMPLGGGWIVIGVQLNDAALDALKQLAPAPVEVRVIAKTEQGWGDDASADFAALTAFMDASLASSQPRPSLLETQTGAYVALAHPLTALDDTRSAVLLRQPSGAALAPYNGLFSAFFLIGLMGLAGLSVAAWLLARGVTRPLAMIEHAAKRLGEGFHDKVNVSAKDELSHFAERFNTMADAIKERERRFSQLAYYDAETRLPNRVAVERKLTTTDQPDRLYLAAIGVDRFAHVRGAIGYALTGMLMRTLGARLAKHAPNAPIARLSSDVMCVALTAGGADDARRQAEALIQSLEETYVLDSQSVDVNVSIGLAQPRASNEKPARMIERASIALDQARAQGQKIAVYDQTAYGDPARNLSLMTEMRRAIESGHISLLHQPKYNFRTGRIESAEVLVRWRHPSRGMIEPDVFVPMAEETGHIRTLTTWVLRSAIADQMHLSNAGWPLTFAVNISARLLSDSEFAHEAVSITRTAPHPICFEITETAIIDNPRLALEHLALFSAQGIRIAIDDYGSGLSSLAYLKQLPAQELKIGKTFIQNISADQRDALLVRSTIDLAHGLGMSVVAEGVETPAAFALLASMGCDMAQGFLVSRPATVDELSALLSDERRMRFYQQTALSNAAPAVAEVKTGAGVLRS